MWNIVNIISYNNIMFIIIITFKGGCAIIKPVSDTSYIFRYIFCSVFASFCSILVTRAQSIENRIQGSKIPVALILRKFFSVARKAEASRRLSCRRGPAICWVDNSRTARIDSNRRLYFQPRMGQPLCECTLAHHSERLRGLLGTGIVFWLPK